MALVFVPESEGWNSESASPSETPTAPSVMWRGKPMPPRSWQRAWEKHSWLRLLSGTTLPPSTASLGVDSWISSLRVTHANRSAMRASDLASMTSATSGRMSFVSGGSAEQLSYFARTSPAILLSDSTRSAETFKAWARGLRQAYSARRKSERLTAESACSSWQTASVVDSVGRDYTYPSGDHSKPFDTLVGQAKKHWPTAKVITGGPEARASRAARDSGGEDLEASAKHWPTATTLDTMDAARKGISENSMLGRQALRPTGQECQQNSGRRLNPRFVEWLMGFPPEWTSFAPAATEWSRWSQLMRYELSRLS